MFKKIMLMIMLVLTCGIFTTNILATTKEDIVSYVNSQSVCGDSAIFNSYKATFTRLLRQKDLSSEKLSSIYSYLQSSVGILNSKGVCKIADLSKLTKAEKNSVYASLTAGAGIITSAPTIEENEKITNNETQGEITNNTEGTNVTVNSQDNTMDIYENGVLIDKLSMESEKMTYTGTSLWYIITIIISLLLFIISLSVFMVLYNKHSAKIRFVKNILMSIAICSGLVFAVTVIFKEQIDSIYSVKNLITFETKTDEVAVKLNEDKSIKTYPSYGMNYGTLSIPALDISSKIYFGDTSGILSLGIGHTTWSNMPTENGVVIYSGHNKVGVLQNLKNVKKNEKIIVDTTYAKCTYTVVKTEILKDTEVDKLTKVNGKETLVLYTCYPFNTYVYANQRYVVYSVLSEVKWK